MQNAFKTFKKLIAAAVLSTTIVGTQPVFAQGNGWVPFTVGAAVGMGVAAAAIASTHPYAVPVYAQPVYVPRQTVYVPPPVIYAPAPVIVRTYPQAYYYPRPAAPFFGPRF